MPLVTLIGEKLAVEKDEFIFLGPQNDCKNCKLKTVCFNLKQGRRYKIIKVRDKKHSCNIHEGSAAVVEVQEMPTYVAVDEKISEGRATKIEKRECKNISCEHYSLCFNRGIQENKEYQIKKIHETINCPAGYNLRKAELA